MPRCQSRARKAHARSVSLRQTFERNIEAEFAGILSARTSEERLEAMEGMIDLLKTIASSDLGLWTFREHLCRPVAGTQELREDVEATLAMIGQIVNRRLAARTPGSVIRRHKQVNCLKSQKAQSQRCE
jgi:hypothetical protein